MYGIALGDLNGNVTYVNNAGLPFWGTDDLSEIIGKPAVSFARSEKEGLEILQSVLEKGSWFGEVTGLRKDGTPIPVELSASIFRNDQGVPIGLMSSYVDITERKRAEQELRIKSDAIQTAINGIGFTDLSGNITSINDAGLHIWGADDPAEVLGKSITSFAESEEEATEIIKTIVKEGRWIGEVTGIRKDGSPFTVELSASLVINNQGEPTGLMGSLVDITERKRAEQELRIKSNAIQSSINGIAFGDLNGNITYINDASLRLWGTDDPLEILGKPAVTFAQSEEEGLKILKEVLEKGYWFGEVTGIRKDGMPITVELSASMIRDDHGKPIGLMSSYVDITERKRTEEELRIKSNAIQSSINGIAFGDLNGNINYVNDAFLELWGTDEPSEIIGKPAIAFAQSEKQALELLKTVLEKGHWIGEVTGIRKDGIPVTVQLSGSMVQNDRGEPIGLMCSFVDISERKRMEEALQRANESLEDRIAERTRELTDANTKLRREIEERKQAERSIRLKEKELQMKSQSLEEMNTALKVLISQREQDKDALEDTVLANVKELILPGIEKLRACRLNDKQRMYVDVIESNMNTIVSPFLRKLSNQYLNLTPMEIQVANLVKEGKSSKDISNLLNISERGIEFHRNNIRLKLGLKNKKANLRTYLLSF
jgi:PAS domain S-box-containing protein